MTPNFIKKAVDALPDRGRDMYQSVFAPASDGIKPSRRKSEFDTWAAAYSDPAFLWNYVQYCVEKDIPPPRSLPADKDGLLLRQVWEFEVGKRSDPLLWHAISLSHPRNEFERTILRAMLVSKSVSVADVCQKTGMSAKLVQLYEKIFFNVLDRMGDCLYTLKLLYPNGRKGEFMSGYLDTVSYDTLLMRAGFRNGINDAMFLMGHRDSDADFIEVSNSADTPERLEAAILANAIILSRAGFGGQSNHAVPVVGAARGMINSAKLGGTDNASGNAALTLAEGIGAELTVFAAAHTEKSTQIRQRLAIEQAQAIDAG
jgi:hypothetical protein